MRRLLLTVSRDVWRCHPEELTRRQRLLALEYVALLEIEADERAARVET